MFCPVVLSFLKSKKNVYGELSERSKVQVAFLAAFGVFGEFRAELFWYTEVGLLYCCEARSPHLLLKSPASGSGIPFTIACAEDSFEE